MMRNIANFLIASGLITLLAGYLGRKFIDNYFDKGMERYKVDLDKLKIEHQVKFTRLHEDRAMVIRELFSKLADVEKSMGSFVAVLEPSGQPPKEEKGKKAANDFNGLVDLFRRNEVYLSDETADLMNEILDEIRTAWFTFTMYPSYKKTEQVYFDEQLANIERDKIAKWLEAWNKITKDLPPLKNRLKKELQALLGMERLA
jgi:hypothetical protein